MLRNYNAMPNDNVPYIDNFIIKCVNTTLCFRDGSLNKITKNVTVSHPRKNIFKT